MNRRKLRLMGQLICQNSRFFIGTLICTLAGVIIGFMPPLLLAETLDYYLSGKPSTMPHFINQWVAGWGGREFMANNLWIVGLALVLLNVINGVFSFYKGRWQAIAGENVARSLREKLYRHIQKLPFSFHVRCETGDLLQRCTSDIDTVRRFLSMQLMAIFNAVLMVVIALYIMLSKNVRITLLGMVVVPALFAFAFLFFKLVVKHFRTSDEAEGKMSAVLQENLTGVRVVRAFGRQQYEVEKFDQVNSDYKKKTFKLTQLLAIYWATSDALTMMQTMIALIVCVFAVTSGEITIGDMTVFTAYIGQLLWPIRQLGRILSDAGKSLVSIERIDEILRKPEEPDEPNAIKPSLNQTIEFDHVSFAYDGSEEVLRNISLRIQPGQTVAILGGTGSGKSTLVHLLQRLFEPTGGEIRIGGVPLTQIDREYLRQHVGLILQEPFLYSKSIRDNVGIAVRGANDEDIDRAVTDACAKQFILESDKGFDTLVGERGVTLSGGQKQRVAISRTLLKTNDILIFDDSLSAVDNETDAQIRAALKSRGGNLTTIIISHRINTLSEADCIFVLENGRVVQQGTHEELKRQPGLYQRINSIQSDLEEELRESQLAVEKGVTAHAGV